MTHDHRFERTEGVMTDAGGGLCIQLVDEDLELFVDADVCACGAIALVMHDADAPGHLTAFAIAGPCGRCDAPAREVGIVSEGGAEIHAPLDRRWTFGLATRVCPEGHVTVTGVGGTPKAGAPPNADLLAQHPSVGTCPCGGGVREVAIESHHSGVVRIDDAVLCAQICALCERVQLAVERQSS